jgi:hypothetical protein
MRGEAAYDGVSRDREGALTLDEFEDALDSFGSVLADWPDDLAAQAQTLLDSSAEARDALKLAETLDGGLDALFSKPIQAPVGLAGRIMAEVAAPRASADIIQLPPRVAAMPEPANDRRAWSPARSSMIAAAAMIVCFAGGFLTVQTVSAGYPQAESVYVSAIYGDLAW